MIPQFLFTKFAFIITNLLNELCKTFANGTCQIILNETFISIFFNYFFFHSSWMLHSNVFFFDSYSCNSQNLDGFNFILNNYLHCVFVVALLIQHLSSRYQESRINSIYYYLSCSTFANAPPYRARKCVCVCVFASGREKERFSHFEMVAGITLIGIHVDMVKRCWFQH